MPRSPRARRIAPSCRLLAAIAVLAASAGAVAEPLTLPDALARAAGHDPTRPAVIARVQAAEAGVRQAAVRPNPSLGVDMENFAGSGQHGILDRSESTFYYQQTWERGGKREARTDVARAELALARGRASVRSLDLLAEVQTAWVDALAAQAAVGVAQERLAVAERLQRDVARRVSAALDPLFAGERARTAVAQARIAHDQAVEAARQARAVLAAYWAGPADFEIDPSPLERTELMAPGSPPEETPDLAVLAAEGDLAAVRVRLEQSRAVQDPTWRAGVRHFADGGDVAVIVGGSIPLGRNDTNRGNIERARAERTAAEADIAAAHIVRQRETARLTARRSAALAEVRRIEAEVLPGAERAVAMVRDGFNRGGGAFTYLEVAEAERAVAEARARRLELLKAFHLDGVRLDRLNGRHALLIASTETR